MPIAQPAIDRRRDPHSLLQRCRRRRQNRRDYFPPTIIEDYRASDRVYIRTAVRNYRAPNWHLQGVRSIGRSRPILFGRRTCPISIGRLGGINIRCFISIRIFGTYAHSFPFPLAAHCHAMSR